jgi:DNA-binding MarR family transcriptional regulator
MSAAYQQKLEELAREVWEITRITWSSAQRTKPEGQYDLSETEFLTLDALEHNTCMTVGEIQRHVKVLPAQMSRIIKSLETTYDRPLITCSINQGDKRKVDVHLSDAGRQAVGAFRRGQVELNLGALKGLPPQDADELLRIVRLIRKAMES